MLVQAPPPVQEASGLTAVSTLRFLAAGLLAVALGGCAIERQLVFDSPAPAKPPAAAPPTVAAAPTTAVSASALPPPPGAAEASPPALPPTSPAAELALSPVSAGPAPDSTAPSLASASATPAEPPRIAPGAQAAGLGGRWTLSSAGQSCQLTLQEPPSSRTGWVQAGPSCGNFAAAASWTLSGSQLLIYDRNTRPLGRLTAAGPDRFEGTSTQGATISLAR
jgi:hypothetical protein